MNQKGILYLIVIFWLLIFSGFILYKEYTLRTGEEVILKTVPIDPRDIFRGDYVVLNYEINNLDMKVIPAEDSYFESNDKIYLALEIKDGYGVAKKVYRTPPENELYIKGTVKYVVYNSAEDEYGGTTQAGIDSLSVDYGIENYFVPEGKGVEIEREQRIGEKGVDVKIVVDKYGNAMIKTLMIDGKEIGF